MKIDIADKTIEESIEKATLEYLRENGILGHLRRIQRNLFDKWKKTFIITNLDSRIKSLEIKISILERKLKK